MCDDIDASLDYADAGERDTSPFRESPTRSRKPASATTPTVSLPCAPLMHGTGLWLGCFIPHLIGAHVITLTNRSLDAHEVLSTIERHQVTSVTIVGDAFAKPLLTAIDEGADGRP